MTTVTVRPAGEADRAELDAMFVRLWGATYVVAHGERMDLRTLPTLVAVDESGAFAGALVWRPDGDEVEVASLGATVHGGGVGTALLDAAVALARSRGARRLYLITTNDNTRALRFYQRRGLRITAIDPGAVDRAREQLKPEIPLVGDDGIPLRDELRLELDLA
jgi:ribosomal protein S18 acetylase RimI-like enzyme